MFADVFAVFGTRLKGFIASQIGYFDESTAIVVRIKIRVGGI